VALNIKRAERPVKVCLDGALTAEWELNRQKVQDASEEYKRVQRLAVERPADDRLNRQRTPAEKRKAELDKELSALADHAQELSTAAEEATVTFRIQALPRHVWDELVSAHPPRPAGADGTSPDEGFPFDTQAVADAALATPGVIVSVTRHDGTAEDFAAGDWPAFAAELSREQHDEFRTAVVIVNAGSNEVPFFRASGKTDASAKK